MGVANEKEMHERYPVGRCVEHHGVPYLRGVVMRPPRHVITDGAAYWVVPLRWAPDAVINDYAEYALVPLCSRCGRGIQEHDELTRKCLFGAGEWT